MNSTISVSNILAVSLGFFWRNVGAILRRTWLTAVMSCMIFYLCIIAYLRELQLFLTVPTDAHASIVLAVTGGTILLLLFVYTIALAAVTDLALGHDARKGLLNIAHQECRLFAALLRLVLMITVLTIAGCLTFAVLHKFAPYLQVFTEAAIIAVLLLLVLRLGFLLPAIAMATRQGVVLRQSWVLSKGNFWCLLAVAAILLIPGLALELLGEFVGHVTGVFPAFNGADTLQAHILFYDRIGPAFAVLLSMSALLTLTLLAIASVTVYRALVGTSPRLG